MTAQKKGSVTMANRPVFSASERAHLVDVFPVEFVWNKGLAPSQKQKNIVAIHDGFKRRFPEKNILEISSKSLNPLGVKLSAFNLKKFVPSIGKYVSVECIYQGAKVFAAGGPFADLYLGTSRAAKGDSRLKSSGALRGFSFEGKTYPLTPVTAFYDWLYITALMENKELADELLQYDSFTDIEFSPEKSKNCQARAAACFVALHRKGLLECVNDFEQFVKIAY